MICFTDLIDRVDAGFGHDADGDDDGMESACAMRGTMYVRSGQGEWERYELRRRQRRDGAR